MQYWLADASFGVGLAVSIGIAVLGMVVSTVNTIVLFRIGQSVKRYERLEDTSEERINDLGGKLHDTATKLIDERFRAMTHDLQNHVMRFNGTLDEMQSRLKEGDGELRSLGDVDQRIEIQLIERISAMKEWFIQNLASKSDLKQHESAVSAKFDRVDERMGVLTREVAVLTDRAER